MNISDILNIIIFSMPEGIAVAAVACGFIGIKPCLKIILIPGILTGALSYFWRPLVGSYIFNVLIYDALLIGLMGFHRIADLFRRAVGVAMATCMYITIEFINMKIIQLVFGINPSTLPYNIFLRLMCFMPQLAAAVFLFFLIKRYNLSLFAIMGDGREGRVKQNEKSL